MLSNQREGSQTSIDIEYWCCYIVRFDFITFDGSRRGKSARPCEGAAPCAASCKAEESLSMESRNTHHTAIDMWMASKTFYGDLNEIDQLATKILLDLQSVFGEVVRAQACKLRRIVTTRLDSILALGYGGSQTSRCNKSRGA